MGYIGQVVGIVEVGSYIVVAGFGTGFVAVEDRTVDSLYLCLLNEILIV